MFSLDIKIGKECISLFFFHHEFSIKTQWCDLKNKSKCNLVKVMKLWYKCTILIN